MNILVVCELIYLFSSFGFKKYARTLSIGQKISPDFLINHLKLHSSQLLMSNF